jgi:hypothetical protein
MEPTAPRTVEDGATQAAQDIRAALKAEGHRGEPSPQLIDRLLVHQLHGQATALRKAARLVNDYADREKVRDAADDLDPFLR